MPINNVPAVQDVIEQVNLLERVFHDPLEANLQYAKLADNEIFPVGIGETLTKTRPALFPTSAALTPLNPANNTGLDNGLTYQTYGFEQYVLPINEYALSAQVNVMQDYTLIQRIFLQNYRALGENAGRTIDALCANQVHNAYDAGSTFCVTTASGDATSIRVDNIVGFDTAFNSTNGDSPGVPSAVSVSNPQAIKVFTNAVPPVLVGSLSVTGVTPDVVNTSTAASVGGVSGFLTVAANSLTVDAGYLLQANDGAYIARPNGKSSRYNLASTDVLDLSTIAAATAKLRARNVPPLPSGMYACIIDPIIWPQLINNTAFEYATMGSMGEGYYRTGMVSRTLGVEFVNSNMVPNFALPSGGSASGAGVARHAVVAGMGLLIKGTFEGHIRAASLTNPMDNGDIRMIKGDSHIAMITRGPIDQLQEFVNQAWKWVGGFVPPTDFTSTPLIIPTTDYARYKRCVVLEVYSAY